MVVWNISKTFYPTVALWPRLLMFACLTILRHPANWHKLSRSRVGCKNARFSTLSNIWWFDSILLLQAWWSDDIKLSRSHVGCKNALLHIVQHLVVWLDTLVTSMMKWSSAGAMWVAKMMTYSNSGTCRHSYLSSWDFHPGAGHPVNWGFLGVSFVRLLWVTWYFKKDVHLATGLKFFRFSILGNRSVFHYKGLVGDIDRWKCISRQ